MSIRLFFLFSVIIAIFAVCKQCFCCSKVQQMKPVSEKSMHFMETLSFLERKKKLFFSSSPICSTYTFLMYLSMYLSW